jgi:hypothetical protein
MFTVTEITDKMRENGFYLRSRASDYSMMLFGENEVPSLLIQVHDLKTIEVLFSIGGAITVSYAQLSVKFLMEDSQAFVTAISRMERIMTSRVVKNMTQEYIDSMLRK